MVNGKSIKILTGNTVTGVVELSIILFFTCKSDKLIQKEMFFLIFVQLFHSPNHLNQNGVLNLTDN